MLRDTGKSSILLDLFFRKFYMLIKHLPAKNNEEIRSLSFGRIAGKNYTHRSGNVLLSKISQIHGQIFSF